MSRTWLTFSAWSKKLLNRGGPPDRPGPEMANHRLLLGIARGDRPQVESIPGPTTDRFQQLASNHGCYIAVSPLEVVSRDRSLTTTVWPLIDRKALSAPTEKSTSYIFGAALARDGDLGIFGLGKPRSVVCLA